MKPASTFISVLMLILLVTTTVVSAEPIFEIHFDAGRSPVGPATNVRINEIGHAYLVVRNADMLVGGASFRLAPPNQLVILGSWLAEGVAIGNLFAGVELGLTHPIPQFGEDIAVIGGFDFLAPTLLIEELMPLPHPDYETIVVANSSGELTSAVSFPGTVFSIIKPEVGLYFDDAGTLLNGTVIGGDDEIFTMYLMVRDLDYPVNSLTMSIDLPASVSYVSATQPDGHGFTGDWVAGAVLFFPTPIEAPGETPLLLATLQLAPGADPIFGAEINIGGHQDYSSTPYVLVAGIGAYEVNDQTSTLSIPIANEAKSWGEVKELYR